MESRIADQAELDRIDAAVEAEMEAAVRFAKASAEPDRGDLRSLVYA